MIRIALMVGVAALAACDLEVAEGNVTQRCIHVETGELLIVDPDKIVSATQTLSGITITLVDQDGFTRTITSAESSRWKCKPADDS